MSGMHRLVLTAGVLALCVPSGFAQPRYPDRGADIREESAMSEEDPLSLRVSAHMRGARLTEFLAVIAGQADISFWTPADIVTTARPVTVDMSEVAAREILSSVLEAQGLTYRRQEDVPRYYIVMRDPLAALVDIRVEGATMEAFLGGISKQTGVRITLEEGVQTRPVTARFWNVTARSAVKTVAAYQGLELRYAEDGKTYVVAKP
mgnify:CR=1 FL=1